MGGEVIRKDQWAIDRIGLSTDSKPTDVAEGTVFYEQDTGDHYQFLSGTWSIKYSAVTPVHAMVYDTGTLTWVAMTQPTSTVSNEAFVLHEDGDDFYICKATIGTNHASALWQVQKINVASGAFGKWCDGNALYDNVATPLGTVKTLAYS
jgi:hypothetical protein